MKGSSATKTLASISDYLEQQHVVTIAGQDDTGPWAANSFYVWQRRDAAFLVLSDPKTRHGQIMAHSAIVCGTVSSQESRVSHLQGVQFVGTAKLLSAEEEKQARHDYYQRFPIARAKPLAIWSVAVDSLKMTNNRLGFGHKLNWQRETNDR